MERDDLQISRCPNCKTSLKAEAVLCVDCGYKLSTGGFLTTKHEAVGDGASDTGNPYTPPNAMEERVDTGEFDLDDRGLRLARQVVLGASMAYVVVAFAVCCSPVGIVLFPYFAYLLITWYSLDASYNELRYPNSLSSNGKLATEFVDAKFRLIFGLVASGCCLTAWGLIWLYSLSNV